MGMAQGLRKYDLVRVEGGHEALFTNPGVIAEELLQALSAQKLYRII